MFEKLIRYSGDFFLCLFIAPAGLLKIALRQSKRKQEFVKGGMKILVVSGVFLIFCFVMIADGSLFTNAFTYLFGSAGIVGAVLGLIMIRQGIRNRNYSAAVQNNCLLKITDIADIMKLPKETVSKDILRMIAEGFFPEYKYDVKEATLKPHDLAVEKIKSKAILCTSCNATVTVFEGKQNKCEYCGIALNY